MGKFAKWIGAGLGFAFGGGPIGAIIGFSLGSIFDSTTINGGQTGSRPQLQSADATTGGYAISLLVLIAAVMKADGKTMQSELEYVKQFLVRNFGSETATEGIRILRDMLGQDIPVEDVCKQIEQNIDYPSRLQLLHFLFGIAAADGFVDPMELQIIMRISINMRISEKDYLSIKSMFVPDSQSWYKILEIDNTVSNDDVKKAYRKMAIKYHPDKVSYLGEDFQHAAKEKFQKVSEAYEAIKKERNFV